MRFEPIVHAQDPRIADYRNVRERDLLERQRVLLAEGTVVVRVLLRQGRYRIRSLLLEERRVDMLAADLALLPSDVPIYVAPQRVFDAIVGLPMHRGVLAAADVGEPVDPGLLLSGPGPSTVLVLEGINNHDNVGGIFRNAKAFGVDAVLLDQSTCSPLYRKAIRVSVGATLLVPFARVEGGILGRLRASGYTTMALTPAVDALDLRGIREVPERLAVLVGAEGDGLRRETLEGAELRVRIAMAPGFDSLNVATAAGIALFALSGASKQRPGLSAPQPSGPALQIVEAVQVSQGREQPRPDSDH